MVLRPCLSTGLPLSNELLFNVQKKTCYIEPGPREKKNCYEVFGGLAIMVVITTLDPWLCVAAFRRVCYYRFRSGRSLA